MGIVNELIKKDTEGKISFGNHTLEAKAKLDDFECCGNIYKVKTFKEMTKLERDGMFVYESVPGTSVNDFVANDKGVSFKVCGDEDAQLIIGLKEDTEYEVFIDDKSVGKMKTNLSGKLSVSVELADAEEIAVKIAE